MQRYGGFVVILKRLQHCKQKKNQIHKHTSYKPHCKTSQKITQTKEPLEFVFILSLLSYSGKFSNLLFNVPPLRFILLKIQS